MELCPELGIAIPVGKDSLSMRTTWRDEGQNDGEDKAVTSPLSLIISAFAPVSDVRKTLTPELQNVADSVLVHVDLGRGQRRLGGSILAQCYSQLGNKAPDVSAADIKAFFNLIQSLNNQGHLLAYHDISDGGLASTVCEMMFAARLGVQLDLAEDSTLLANLFAEEIGAVVQMHRSDYDALCLTWVGHSLEGAVQLIGTVNNSDTLTIGSQSYARSMLQQYWSEVSTQIQSLRDNSECAQQENALISNNQHQGLQAKATYDLDEAIEAPYINKGAKPKIAILREQGVNGQLEMAAAFYNAGFDSIDVHMDDLIHGRINLADMQALVACGGFSYGDVLGAGGGWAKTILQNPALKDMFSRFFAQPNTLSLGVCNGCQMMSQLKDIIPGATHWPQFKQNTSERFEARLVNVIVEKSTSLLMQDMHGSLLPIAVAHGEGRVVAGSEALQSLNNQQQILLRYSDSHGQPTQHYPLNPNGSPEAIAGVCSQDGRATILMPHPERVYRAVQHTWRPAEWQLDGAWMRMFRNARKTLG